MVRWLEKRGEEREVGRETDVLASLFSSYQIRGELHSISQLSGFSTSDRRDWEKGDRAYVTVCYLWDYRRFNGATTTTASGMNGLF